MKRIIFVLFIVISLIIIYNFFSSIYRLLSKNDVLIQAQTELAKEQQENTDLKKKLNHVKNPNFMEEQARDKLFFIKPGEKTVVIPQSLLPTPTSTPAHGTMKPNWQQWLDLFFH